MADLITDEYRKQNEHLHATTNFGVYASPTLNATININPKPTRPNAMALRSTTSAVGHGISPPEMPNASRLRMLMRPFSRADSGPKRRRWASAARWATAST